MSRDKRQHESDSEDYSDFEDDEFYNDPLDLNDSFSDDEQELVNEDPLESENDFSELSVEFGDDVPLGRIGEDNFDLHSESASNDESFDSDSEVESDDADDVFEGSSEDEWEYDYELENTEAPMIANVKERELEVKWENVPSTFVPRKKIPAYKEPEIRVKKDSRPVDIFFKLFPMRLFHWIAKCTNERLDILAKRKGKEVPHTDSSEMVLIIGCLLVMGYNRLPQMQMYWSNKSSLGNKTIKNAITRERFMLLASKLYFNHPEKPKGASKTYYMDELVKCLKHTFMRARGDSTFQSIDETMVLFKGRWEGKQFMPKKKIRRGAKIWSRSDAMSGFCYDFNIYTKEEEPVAGTLGERVVIKLCSTIGDENVVICTDRFFTSYELMRSLPFACVGTCMNNRRNIPKIPEKLNKGESIAKSTVDGIIGFKWQDSKEVTVLSNCHNYDITTVERKQKDGVKKSVPCPEAISFYNKYMGGVDMTDQYTVLYDINRKSNKWWKRVFQRLLMTAVTNTWVLHKQIEYKKLNTKKIPLIDMLVPLAEELIDIGKAGSKVQRNFKIGRPPKRPKEFVDVQHLPVPCTKRRCALCSTKNIQKRTSFMCSTCEAPLCTGCFLPYHQQ